MAFHNSSRYENIFCCVLSMNNLSRTLRDLNSSGRGSRCGMLGACCWEIVGQK